MSFCHWYVLKAIGTNKTWYVQFSMLVRFSNSFTTFKNLWKCRYNKIKFPLCLSNTSWWRMHGMMVKWHLYLLHKMERKCQFHVMASLNMTESWRTSQLQLYGRGQRAGRCVWRESNSYLPARSQIFHAVIPANRIRNKFTRSIWRTIKASQLIRMWILQDPLYIVLALHNISLRSREQDGSFHNAYYRLFLWTFVPPSSIIRLNIMFNPQHFNAVFYRPIWGLLIWCLDEQVILLS